MKDAQGFFIVDSFNDDEYFVLATNHMDDRVYFKVEH